MQSLALARRLNAPVSGRTGPQLYSLRGRQQLIGRGPVRLGVG